LDLDGAVWALLGPWSLDRKTKLNHKSEDTLAGGWLFVDDIEFQGYIPGAIGRIAELHGTYYHRHWGFGLFFEARVAKELSEFLARFDKARDGFWTLCSRGRVEGAVAIDGIQADSEGAHLRWFIISSKLRGKGFGHDLLEKALAFCRDKGYHRIYLCTFEGLDAARHLYEKFGFRLHETHEGTQWGSKVNEQTFVLTMRTSSSTNTSAE
jgi:GNAT superfamily N-acetyltransferase